ncbi:hypothetical protein B0H17DRAFT_1131715 [Mycena rosella]|uniref:Uncharacterized protein n=1 Tax=Mycena rosella TaxID=1033263 RepID=A0AAD7DMG9_MYCRO|nr:hypothetical protein B0H17DRAFT_1131715 [Mycena rosella]
MHDVGTLVLRVGDHHEQLTAWELRGGFLNRLLVAPTSQGLKLSGENASDQGVSESIGISETGLERAQAWPDFSFELGTMQHTKEAVRELRHEAGKLLFLPLGDSPERALRVMYQPNKNEARYTRVKMYWFRRKLVVADPLRGELKCRRLLVLHELHTVHLNCGPDQKPLWFPLTHFTHGLKAASSSRLGNAEEPAALHERDTFLRAVPSLRSHGHCFEPQRRLRNTDRRTSQARGGAPFYQAAQDAGDELPSSPRVWKMGNRVRLRMVKSLGGHRAPPGPARVRPAKPSPTGKSLFWKRLRVCEKLEGNRKKSGIMSRTLLLWASLLMALLRVHGDEESP